LQRAGAKQLAEIARLKALVEAQQAAIKRQGELLREASEGRDAAIAKLGDTTAQLRAFGRYRRVSACMQAMFRARCLRHVLQGYAGLCSNKACATRSTIGLLKTEVKELRQMKASLRHLAERYLGAGTAVCCSFFFSMGRNI
jgi:hypothetical protein